MMGEAGPGKYFFGRVTRVYRLLGCVAIKAEYGVLSIGDTIRFSKGGKKPDLYQLDQRVVSMEINRKPVSMVGKGQEFAVKLNVGPDALPPNNARVIVLQD